MGPYEDDEDDDDRPHRSPRTIALGWAGVAVLVVIAAWFGWSQAQQPVRWADVGFSIVSPTEATATFEVYLYTDADAECRLRALNENFAEVGIADVVVLRADGAQQRLVEPVATTELATALEVKYCRSLG